MLPKPELPAFEPPTIKVEAPKLEGFKPPPALEVRHNTGRGIYVAQGGAAMQSKQVLTVLPFLRRARTLACLAVLLCTCGQPCNRVALCSPSLC